mgnify:CR=1 FL=1
MSKAEEKIEDTSDEFAKQSMMALAAMEGMEAYNTIMSQTVGMASMAVSNLEQLNIINEEQSESFRKVQAGIELLIMPLEIYLMLQQFNHAQTMADVAAKEAQAGATAKATASQTGLNAAMTANPIGAIILGILILVGALVALQMKFDIINKTLYFLDDAMNRVKNTIEGMIDGIEGLTTKTGILADMFKATPIGMAMELTGGIR